MGFKGTPSGQSRTFKPGSGLLILDQLMFLPPRPRPSIQPHVTDNIFLANNSLIYLPMMSRIHCRMLDRYALLTWTLGGVELGPFKKSFIFKVDT
jgi:hypothetical protein